jgi:UDP-galactopyranose mutase
MLPFARNEATRFISPTKTPEYLAAGKPVVSTSIRDVVLTYGESGLARIADRPDAFSRAIDDAMGENPALRLAAADRLIARMSWTATWSKMEERIAMVLERSRGSRAAQASTATDRAGRLWRERNGVPASAPTA